MAEENAQTTESRLIIERTKTFWIILVFAVLQVVIGGFVLYGNTRLSNVQEEQQRFTDCQAQYNQDFREVFDDISESSRQTQSALFEFLKLTPTILEQDSSVEDIVRFKEKSEAYIRLYLELQEKRKTTKYPEPPTNFCGTYLDPK